MLPTVVSRSEKSRDRVSSSDATWVLDRLLRLHDNINNDRGQFHSRISILAKRAQVEGATYSDKQQGNLQNSIHASNEQHALTLLTGFLGSAQCANCARQIGNLTIKFATEELMKLVANHILTTDLLLLAGSAPMRYIASKYVHHGTLNCSTLIHQ